MFTPPGCRSPRASGHAAERWLDRVYDDFTGQGRRRPRADPRAGARAWPAAGSGPAPTPRHRGLVDELGGLDLAVDLAREKAGLPADAPARVFPHTSPLDRLRPPESSEDRTAAHTRWDAWGPLTGAAGRLGLPAAGPLTLPGSWDIR